MDAPSLGKKRSTLNKTAQKLAQLCGIMLRIGCIGFGGGSALIPVMHEELVEEHQFVTEEEFNKDVVVASITPGALPVEIAVGIGRKTGGTPGMLLAACCIALPGAAMTVLVSAFLALFGSAITRQINFLAIGVSAYIIYVLFGYVKSSVDDAARQGKRLAGILTAGAVLLFTCGSNLYDALGFEATPFFSVSTANVMAVAFFLVFFLRGHYRCTTVIPACAVALAYLVCAGKNTLIPAVPFQYVLQAVMVCLALWGLWQEFRRERVFLRQIWKPVLKDTSVWLLFLCALALPAIFLYEDGIFLFLGKGCLSTLISFGGGDAYLAVAGGMFVTGGIILRADFYNKVVTTANAFPGSILCKVLSGIGYFAGYRATGSVFIGLMVALAGFAASIAASGFTFSLIANLYERFETSALFGIIKEVIRPIISGLLLTVAISFFSECLDVGSAARWPDLCAPLLCLALAVGCHLFAKKFGHRPLRIVGLCAGISLLFCNLFELFF